MVYQILSSICLGLLFFTPHLQGALWTTPIDVMVFENPVSDIQLVIDSRGNSTVVWIEQAGADYSLKSSTSTYGGSWGTPLTIPIVIDSTAVYSLVVDPAGNVTVVCGANIPGSSIPLQSSTKQFGVVDWDTSVSISDDKAVPTAAIDFEGNITAVWSPEGEIRTSTKSFGQTNWGPQSTIFSSSTERIDFPQSLVIDPAGNATLVWSGGLPAVSNYLQSATRAFNQPNWQLSNHFYESSSFIMGSPALTVDPAGNVTALFRVSGVGVILSATKPYNKAWQTPTQVVVEANPVSDATPYADLLGNVTAVWRTGAGGTDSIVRTSIQPYGGDWKAPETIPYQYPSFSISGVVDRSGNLTIATTGVVDLDTGQACIQSTTRPYGGGAWQAPEIVSSDDVVALDPVLAVNSTGDVVAIWTTFGSPGKIQSATRTPVPIITNVSPSSGPPSGGTEVTITGEHFDGALGVLFGTTPAVSPEYLSSTTIRAIAPPGVVGTVDVQVITPQGTSLIVETDQYTYSATPLPPSHFRGEVKKRRGHHRKHPYRLTAKWRPSPSTNVESYRVYKRSKVVGIIPVQSHCVYRDHLRWRGSTKKFSIVAVGAGTFESTSVKLKVRH